MTDDLVPVPVPDAVRALPSPREISTALIAELTSRSARVRVDRGDVHQPEDTYPLVRALQGARELLEDYGRAFATAAALAADELRYELVSAVGEQDGVPVSGLLVPDLDGTDIALSKVTSNSYDIDQRSVIAAVISTTVVRMADTEPLQQSDEGDQAYDDRYWRWFTHVIETAIDQLFALGTFTLQVSKVRAYMTTLSGQGDDAVAAVLRTSIRKTEKYGGVKIERKERRKR